MTKVVRIKIDSNEISFAAAIENECSVMAAVGYKLASSVVIGENLVMIFQK